MTRNLNSLDNILFYIHDKLFKLENYQTRTTILRKFLLKDFLPEKSKGLREYNLFSRIQDLTFYYNIDLYDAINYNHFNKLIQTNSGIFLEKEDADKFNLSYDL